MDGDVVSRTKRGGMLLDRVIARLVQRAADRRTRGRTATVTHAVLKCVGVDWLPRSIGPGLVMPHASTGSVVHESTRIGAGVWVFQGVTIGRSDPRAETPGVVDDAEGVVLEDDVLLGANAAILFRSGQTITIGTGTVIGANAVVRNSTGPGEVWAGNPAVRLR